LDAASDELGELDEPIIVSTVGFMALELKTSELGSLTSLLIFSIVLTLVPTRGALSAGILLPIVNAISIDKPAISTIIAISLFFTALSPSC
jgi:hypothetical protein